MKQLLTLAIVATGLAWSLVSCEYRSAMKSERSAKVSSKDNVSSEEKVGSTDKKSSMKRVVKSDAEWRRQLSAEEYRITRQKGTEPAFTGKYWDSKTSGIYQCVACGQPVFDSETKFDSGTGWPSFWEPIEAGVGDKDDNSLWMRRTEVTCSRCDSHLGHVFPDGPRPTGLRYCINSASLKLVEREERKDETKDEAKDVDQ